MARVRTRIKRSLYLLFALLVLLLLLQLNQWLPGTWKGGGEGGFRTAGDLGLRDPTKAEDRQPASRDAADPGSVQAPSEPPKDWPPKVGIVVELRGPGGEREEGWRLGVGSGGAENAAPDEGTVTLRDARVFGQGFRIRHAGHVLRHRHGLDIPATRYVVHAPQGSVPRTRRAAAVEVHVVDPETGTPIAGAQLSWQNRGMSSSVKTDAEGKAQVKGESGEPFPVRITKAGHVDRKGVWVRPRRAGSARLELPVETTKTITFRWADRRPAAITRLDVLSAEGLPLARVDAGDGPPRSEVRFKLPAHELAGARMVVRAVGTDVEGYRVNLPLADVGAEVLLPRPRTVRIVARDVNGEPVADAEVVVVYESGEDQPAGWLPPYRTLTNRSGEARVSLPPEQGCRITVQRGMLGPAARRLSAVDGSDSMDLVLEQGVMVPVRLAPAGGGGLLRLIEIRGARQGVPILKHHMVDRSTGATSVRVGPLPPGPIEVFGGARNHAWAAKVAEARSTMDTLVLPLERAYPLMLVVEDAFGVAIQGATVELAVTGDGDPHVVPPSAADWRTDGRGRVGIPTSSGISSQEIPDRRYDVRVSAPGYSVQVLRGIRPGGALHFVTLLRTK